MSERAQIQGQVMYREGDGQNIEIRPGPCEVEQTELDATISWDDGNTKGVAAIPIADFQRYVKEGAIQLRH
ncbi:hypothetical protein [Eleftheria terrae]|uniref:hypothetical protein n=1 Tax=Eleftheria terrae TaxID=1597781 RepID=UPI00263AB2AA|nr:hypothetical protein [Eleftheria terrae]WKB53182.1 hypothetical protein N7L95_01905 [Eleftheria terrae]